MDLHICLEVGCFKEINVFLVCAICLLDIVYCK